MPNNEQAMRFQQVVYWESNGIDAYGNHTIAAEPCELMVRWEDTRNQSYNVNDETVSIDVVLDTEDELVIGSAIWKGCLEDLPDPPVNIPIYRVVKTDNIPDVKGRSFATSASLTRLKNNLPAIL